MSVNKLKLPLTLEVENFNSELKNIAKANNISSDLIDYEIKDIKTFLIKNNEEIEITSINRTELENEIKNNKISIRQSYIVSFFEKTEESEKEFIDISIKANKSLSKVFLIFNKEIKNIENIKEFILKAILKKKMKLGLLLNIFDINESLWLSEIIAKIQIYEKFNFEDRKFLISESFEPLTEINSHFKIFYKKEENDQRIDHSKRNFVIQIKKDQLIMSFIKSKEGSAGLNCRGTYIEKKDPDTKVQINFKTEDGIEVKEFEDKIDFYSQKNGYLSLNKGLLMIKNTIDISEVSFKKTGSIESDSFSDIHLNIVKTSDSHDQVFNTIIEVETLSLAGNVGPSVNIITSQAQISGQVHKSSLVKADLINIGRLKGRAQGKNIKIGTLEQGNIKGESVTIDIANGGIIIGEEIYIKELRSNTYVMASKSIIIDHIIGEDNQLIISPFTKISKYELNEKVGKINSAEQELLKIKDKLLSLLKIINNSRVKIKELKEKAKYLESLRISLPPSLDYQLKQNGYLVRDVKELHAIFTKKEFELKSLQKELDSLSINIENSFISVKSFWSEHNKVIFKIAPGNELLYKPKKFEKTDIMKLIHSGNGYKLIH